MTVIEFEVIWLIARYLDHDTITCKWPDMGVEVMFRQEVVSSYHCHWHLDPLLYRLF